MGDAIYLDYNASSPCDPRVVAAMSPLLTEVFANPASRNHRPGQRAAELLEAARATVARALGARSAEIVFTSGATEANNLALKGLAAAGRRRHVVTQPSEHASVLEPLRQLGGRGWAVTVVGVEADGRVRLDQLEAALRDDTAVVSVMLANNETGTLQPIAEVAALAREVGALVHCDAAQAVGKIPLDVARLGVDLLTFSGHKMCGPKGIGGLYRARRRPPVRLEPLLAGGGHEGGLRSGTVNVPAAVGLACAFEVALEQQPQESDRLATLRDCLERLIFEQLDGVTRNGHPSLRLPGTSNLSFAGVDGQSLLAAIPDIAVGTGSACTSSDPEPSHVLLAMGVARELAAASLRFSLGRFTTGAEVECAAGRVVEAVTRLRRQRPRRQPLP